MAGDAQFWPWGILGAVVRVGARQDGAVMLWPHCMLGAVVILAPGAGWECADLPPIASWELWCMLGAVVRVGARHAGSGGAARPRGMPGAVVPGPDALWLRGWSQAVPGWGMRGPPGCSRSPRAAALGAAP
ncbi:unnamed protein product [Natator depressus]